MGRIRITRANDHPFDTRLDKSRGTGAGPALGAARLKGKINGGTPGCIHAVPTRRILKSFYLGMRLPGRSMPANTQFLPIFHNHRPNRRIRTGYSHPKLCQMQCPAHVFAVVHRQALAPKLSPRKDRGKHAKNLRERCEWADHFRNNQQSLIKTSFRHTFVRLLFAPWNTVKKSGELTNYRLILDYKKKN